MVQDSLVFHITGFISIVFIVFGLHFASNDSLKKTMITASLLNAINMYFNDQFSGMFVNIISVFRNYISLNLNAIEKYIHQIMFCFIALYAISTYISGDKYWYLPLLASIIGLFALFKLTKEKTRAVLFFGTITWLLYAFLNNNIYGVILEFIVLSSFISSFILNKGKYKD